MRIAIDIGHMGKVVSPNDRGAACGKVREADCALNYGVVAWHELERLGHNVYLICHGDYTARKEFVRRINADVHVQCHVNAGGGKYSLLAYRDDALPGTASLCACMADELNAAIGSVISNVKVNTLKAVDRGYDCLLTQRISVLYEPFFIDNAAHLKRMTEPGGLALIGIALAKAIDTWWTKGKGGG